MAKEYLQGTDLDQGCLLPVDPREWLPVDHSVWLFLDVLAGLDMSQFEVANRRGGVGASGYGPRCLLGVLLYGYSSWQRSSRVLERLCQQDVAFCMLTRGLFPDHTTIARFRAAHELAIADVFAQVLVLCAQAGMVRLETVSIDGTKIAASASRLVNRSADGVARELELARTRARKVLAEAAEVDATEDAVFGERRGDEIPADLIDRDARVRHIKEALDHLSQREADAESRREEERVARSQYLERVADPDQESPGKPLRGTDLVLVAKGRLARTEKLAERAVIQAALAPNDKRAQSAVAQRNRRVRDAVDKLAEEEKTAELNKTNPPKPTRHEQRAAKQIRINLTDPQSRAMATSNGWVQGYNTQLAVSDDQIIIAVNVTNDPIDVHQFEPMMTQSQAVAEQLRKHRPDDFDRQIGVVLADAGYFSDANVTCPGLDRIIATGRAHKLPKAEPEKPPSEGASLKTRMTYRTRTEAGRQAYGRRGVTVEPVNGHLKTITGLRQMSRRGLAAAQAEIAPASTALNLAKLFRSPPQAA